MIVYLFTCKPVIIHLLRQKRTFYYKYDVDVLKDKDNVSVFGRNYILDKTFEMGLFQKLS